jgi:DNA-binding IclR family transcriptional regulator
MVALVVWGPHAPTAVRVQPGVDRLNVNVREGTIFSVVGSASGRVFAAFSDGEVVGARIRQELDGEARDRGLGVHATRREFEAGLRRVRRLAYAEGSGVPTPGVNSIAAPVFSASGAVELVLSVIGTADALPIGSRSGAVGHLAQTCRALSSFWPRTPALTAKA